MKELLIVGAGGYGREISAAVQDTVGYGTEFVLKGFLDRNAAALDGFPGYPPVLGAPEDYEIGSADVFFVALGSLALRRRNVELLSARGGRFQTLIHKTASLGRTVEVGEGTYIAHNAILTADIRIGQNASVFHGAVVGHDCRVGDCSHVGALAFLGGGVQVGRDVMIHPGARVVPFKRLGDGSTVGVGSVILTNVSPGTTVFSIGRVLKIPPRDAASPGCEA